MKKLISIILGAVVVAAVSACQGTDEPEKKEQQQKPSVVAVSSVSLNHEDVNLFLGETLSLEATVLPENASDKTITWSSSNPAVASVEDGLVTAHKEGLAIITAKAGEIIASCSVTVTVRPPVRVESVTLNKHETTIEVGSSETLTATVAPDDADFPEVSWKSSDESVATVAGGVVSAIAEGAAVITATADGQSDSCVVSVPHVPVPVTSVSLNKTETVIEVGETETLTATVSPDNADHPEVGWSSSDEAVAKVDENGLVSAIAEGTAVITATADGKSASCTVTVPHKYIPVESVSLNKPELYLELGDSETLVATVNPSNADNPSVSWSSSDESVATVVNGVVTAMKIGSATITATAEGKSATCVINVKNKVIAVSSVTLDKSSATLFVRESVLLTATVLPDDATDKSVVWTSSAPTVASVENGLVTAIAEGTAIITVESVSSGLKASCTVQVKERTPDGNLEGLTETEPEIDD